EMGDWAGCQLRLRVAKGLGFSEVGQEQTGEDDDRRRAETDELDGDAARGTHRSSSRRRVAGDDAHRGVSLLSRVGGELRVDLVEVTLAIITVPVRSPLVEDRRQHVDAARVVVARQLQLVAPLVEARSGDRSPRFIGSQSVSIAEEGALAPAWRLTTSLGVVNRGRGAV